MNSYHIQFDLVNPFTGQMVRHHDEVRGAANGLLAMIQAHDELRTSLGIIGKRINEKFEIIGGNHHLVD